MRQNPECNGLEGLPLWIVIDKTQDMINSFQENTEAVGEEDEGASNKWDSKN
jgi:hypothetical protein